jgi:hypothetical protein
MPQPVFDCLEINTVIRVFTILEEILDVLKLGEPYLNL